jgi:hypothetical protein
MTTFLTAVQNTKFSYYFRTLLEITGGRQDA